MWTKNFQLFKLDLEKTEQPEIKLPTCVGLQKKQEHSRKISTSVSLTMLQPLTVWIKTNCGKFFKRWGSPDHRTYLLRYLYAVQEATVRTRHGTMDWFQIGKGEHQGCILSPCLLTYMQSKSWKIMKQKLESRFQGEISIISGMQMTTPLWQKANNN